jgi:hypothetical protein
MSFCASASPEFEDGSALPVEFVAGKGAAQVGAHRLEQLLEMISQRRALPGGRRMRWDVPVLEVVDVAPIIGQPHVAGFLLALDGALM